MIIEKKKVATEWDGGWFCQHCWSFHHWKEKANITENYEKICDKCVDKYE